ncbi:hypothetical protein YK48G_15630 [Lentilactobacillus fungorum]|uniref:ribose-5-phosphate isomerase n=1 Tax=Lentilactobacillus fungorum TaxID=2201250 RepID=A0ABQ3W0E3_9LACO|nr:hypothetical protein YK48G_15630 [Lentilactobacillus fungorum]
MHWENTLNKKGFSIVGVPTSERTKKQANDLGITTKGIDEVDRIDWTIDGADQIDQNCQGIKGGGGAHLWEKIVAINSNRNMWLGSFLLCTVPWYVIIIMR